MAVAQAKQALPLALIGTAMASATLLAGCATTIVPPASPPDPATAYVLDHGRTPSLVLPGEEGVLTRYVYGDWKFYALRQNDLGHGIAALLWPTQGALGRMSIESTDDVELMLHRFDTGVEHVYTLQVDRTAVVRLHERLDDLFRTNRETLVRNEPYALDFVHHPRRYTCLYNSNHALAAWLRELGCKTRGVTLTSTWKLESDRSPD